MVAALLNFLFLFFSYLAKLVINIYFCAVVVVNCDVMYSKSFVTDVAT